MIRIKLDKIGEIECDEYSIRQTPPRYGGWYDVPPEIHLTLLFIDKIPLILHKIAMSNWIIEELKIYPKNSLPVIILRYVKIIQEEISSIDVSKVYMDALTIIEHGGFNKIIDRKCECGHEIQFWFVINKMYSKIGLSTEVINYIWNNDLFVFKCCSCFEKDTTLNVIL